MENRSSVEEGMKRVSQMLDMLLEVSLFVCLFFCFIPLFVCRGACLLAPTGALISSNRSSY